MSCCGSTAETSECDIPQAARSRRSYPSTKLPYVAETASALGTLHRVGGVVAVRPLTTKFYSGSGRLILLGKIIWRFDSQISWSIRAICVVYSSDSYIVFERGS